MSRPISPGKRLAFEVTPSIESRFFRKIRVTRSGCWLWKGCIDDDGYGRFWVGPGVGQKLAHRVSVVLAGDKIQPGRDVHHRCKRRHCVCPVHCRQLSRSHHIRAELLESIPF